MTWAEHMLALLGAALLIWNIARVTLLDHKVDQYRKRCDQDERAWKAIRDNSDRTWNLARFGELGDGEFC
jgi:hypothetical protein